MAYIFPWRAGDTTWEKQSRSNLLSVVVWKHSSQSNLRMEGFIWLTCAGHNPSPREDKTETWSLNLKGTLHTSLLSLAFSTTFLVQQAPPASGWHPLQSAEPSYINQSAIEKIQWRQFFTWGSLFPGNSRFMPSWQPKTMTKGPSKPHMYDHQHRCQLSSVTMWASCSLQGRDTQRHRENPQAAAVKAVCTFIVRGWCDWFKHCLGGHSYMLLMKPNFRNIY